MSSPTDRREYRLRSYVTGRSRQGVMSRMVSVSKIFLLLSLGAVFFVHDLPRVMIFAFMTLAVCLVSRFNPFDSVLRVGMIAATVFGVAIYKSVELSGLGVDVVLFGSKIGLVAIVAFVMADGLYEREIAWLAPRRLRPAVLVVFSGRPLLQRVFQDATLVRRLRGLGSSWWLLRRPGDYLAAVLSPMVNAAEDLAGSMVINMELRGYLLPEKDKLKKIHFGPVDYLGMLLGLALIALATL